MPTLNWIGKEKVINHHNDVPYRVLEKIYTYDSSEESHDKENVSDNMLIHGDNLEVLKALLPKYEGKIKCIYIDPPYNTGNEKWTYNDNVNDPVIKKWLGEVVGSEGEDLSRHDKWLCMMYPRLRLLQKLLSDDGCLIISISYHELNNLVLLCNEIFSTKQIVTITVQTSGGKPSAGFNYVQEYLVFVVPKDFEANSTTYFGGTENAPFHGMNLATFTQSERPNQTYPIYIEKSTGKVLGCGKSLAERVTDGEYVGELDKFEFDYDEAPEGATAIWPVTTKGLPCVWRLIPSRFLSDLEQGYIKVIEQKSKGAKNKFSVQYLAAGIIEKIESKEIPVISRDEINGTVCIGKYLSAGINVPTIWTDKAFYTTKGSNQVLQIFGTKAFSYPKPVELIKNVIELTTTDGDIVLDSFAGSGSTGQAVLELNAEAGINRKFILVEMGDYAENITGNRLKKVISGYPDESGVEKKTGGTFSYFELGEPLFEESGSLNCELDISQIRQYIWFMETREKYDFAYENTYYLGKNKDTAYYFIYDKSAATTLDIYFLSTIKEKVDAYVIYADACAISEKDLAKWNITFKKIPRDISKI